MLKDIVESAGIPRDSVKTSGLKVERAFRSERAGIDRNGCDVFREVEDGYGYMQDMHFEFPTDCRRLSDMIARIGACDVTSRIRISFRNSDPEGMRKRALDKACRCAREEAGAIVSAVGARLGRLVSVDRYFGTPSEGEDGGFILAMDGDVHMVKLDTVPEDYSVEQSVEMVWEIAD